MAMVFSITWLVAFVIALGGSSLLNPASRRALIANGFFDFISSEILTYAGFVDLMVYEFLFSNWF